MAENKMPPKQELRTTTGQVPPPPRPRVQPVSQAKAPRPRRQGPSARPPRRRKPRPQILKELKREGGLLRILRRLLIVALIIAVLTLGWSVYLKRHYQYDIISKDAAAKGEWDAILVLGCGVYADGSPTPMLQERIDAGLLSYFKGAAPKLLLSGDHGQKHYDEVNAMKNVVLAAGVPEENVFLDHAGFNTYDSLKRAKDIFGVKKICIVTQEYHLYRALYLADSLGLEYCGVAADKEVHLGQSLREIREILARVKAIYSSIFQPPAEIMGTPIDIKGDGRVSFD